jgi:hypothetical protein
VPELRGDERVVTDAVTSHNTGRFGTAFAVPIGQNTPVGVSSTFGRALTLAWPRAAREPA